VPQISPQFTNSKPGFLAFVTELCFRDDFGGKFLQEDVKSNVVSWRLGRISLIAAVILIIVASALYSRIAQYDTMVLNVSDFFLPGLTNVSTTNDSGYYLNQAKLLLERPPTNSEFSLVGAGELLGYFLSMIVKVLEVNLETAGRYLVYGSAVLTSLATYFFLAAQRQQILAFVVAIAMCFYWPVLSRTSVGMLDTDLLNLCFCLAILGLIALLSGARSRLKLISLVAVAGILNYLFYLWYAKPGFFLAFCGSLILTLIASRTPISSIIISSLLFTILSGVEQVTASYDSLKSFLSLYVSAPGLSQSTDSHEFITSMIFSSVSEINALTTRHVRSDIGTLSAFTISLVGLTLWFISDWRRIVFSLPLILFLYLYFFHGHRFGFYAAPLILIGAYVASSKALNTAFYLVTKATIEVPEQKPIERGENLSQQASDRQIINWKGVSLALSLLLLSWPAKILTEVGSTPPPILLPSEVLQLRSISKDLKQKDIIVASWWDYGHEIRYQTGRVPIVDGGNPANIRNVYLARALVTPDVAYASDEVRYASYFSEDQLKGVFPDRPFVSEAKDVERDIYLFIPRDLQFRMITIHKIAAQVLPSEQIVNYDSRSSVFFKLYHDRPKSLGPFELVSSIDDGAVIYRLPAPKRK